MDEHQTEAPSVRWLEDGSFEIDGVGYVCDQYGVRIGSESRFCLAKIPVLVDRYVTFLGALQPRRIVEVGIAEGASTAMLTQLVRPSKLVAVDINRPSDKLCDFIATKGLDDVVAVYGEVDQADAARLDEIVDTELDGPIDLVVDDASHLYEPTVSTFNCLFPRLRSGGVYLLEDWATGLRPEGPVALAEGQRPLVDLVSSVIALKGRRWGVVGDVTVMGGWTTVVRGDRAVERPFDVDA